MCQTYIDEIGYICYECKEEFRDFVQQSTFQPENKNQIDTLMTTFMATTKDSFSGEKMTIDEYFNKFER